MIEQVPFCPWQETSIRLSFVNGKITVQVLRNKWITVIEEFGVDSGCTRDHIVGPSGINQILSKLP